MRYKDLGGFLVGGQKFKEKGMKLVN